MRRTIFCVVLGALLVMVTPAAAYAALVAEWRMDETSGNTMVDSATGVGGPNSGTISGGVEIDQAPLAGGRAYEFDGSTGFVSVPDNSSLDPGAASITLSAVVRVADAPMSDDSYDLIRKGVTTTPGGDWKMEIKRTSNPSVGKLLCVFKGTGGAVQKMANRDLVDGNVHRVECIKTGNSVTAVVDGARSSTSASAGSIANDQPVVLGSKVAGDDVLRGVMDQVKVSIG